MVADTKHAVEAFKRGDFVTAAELYSAALAAAETAQERAAALVNRAQCHVSLGHFIMGREDAAAARALDPENPKAWYRLGVCEARNGNLTDAESALNRALDLRPGDKAVADALAMVRCRRLEATGRYPWRDIYARYLMKEQGTVSGLNSAVAPEAPTTVLAHLGLEPFVGPVRVGFSDGRGRGLFVTEDVGAGTLLLCAQALVTGENEKIPGMVMDCMRRSPELREFIPTLSCGTRESELVLPALDPSQLVAPHQLLQKEADDSADATADLMTVRDLEKLLYYNQFSLPVVNPNAAPIEVSNDFKRSGFWLLPAFANHSCLPNVQRTIVKDCLFLRAGRDLRAGEELFECYIETLQPLERRRGQLEGYGIEVCRCERCGIEEQVLNSTEVRAVLEAAVEAKQQGEEDQVAEASEAVLMQAEILVARSVDRALQEGKVPASRRYPLPETPLAAERMAVLREGIEKFSDAAEEQSFALQDSLHSLLLGSLANVVRAYAMSLRGLNRYVDASAAWTRILDVLDQVIPCSELSSIIASEMLSTKLLAFQLDASGRARSTLRRALVQCHKSYGGGVEAWRTLNAQCFAPTVLDAADVEWACLQKERRDLTDDSFDVAALRPVFATVQPKPQVGFEDLLKRKSQGDRRGGGYTSAPDKAKASPASICASPPPAHGEERPAELAATATAAVTVPAANARSVANPTPPGLLAPVPMAISPATPEPSAVLEWRAATFEISQPDTGELVVVVSLPGLASASEASLEVSERELQIRSLRGDVPHAIDVPLPRCVEPDRTAAKWSKRSQQLTLRLKVADR